MLGVVFYQPVDNVMELAPVHYPAHHAWAEQCKDAGELLMLGTFGDPVADGSMAVLVSKEAAHRFVDGDPFVLNGVVASWRVLEWDQMFPERR